MNFKLDVIAASLRAQNIKILCVLVVI